MENFPTTMLRFVRDVYGAVALDEAWAEFHLWDEDEPGFDPDSHHLQLFMPWFFHQWAPDPFETSVADPVLHDRTPTTVLLERRGRRLEPVLRRYLEACVARPFSFHEIVRVDPGRGFRARDVMTGEELDVLERSASRTMEAGDILFGQLVPSEGVTLMEACSPHMIPAGEKLRLIDLRDRIARGAPLATDESLRDWDTELRIEYLRQIDALRNPSMPRVQNTDGEVLEFHRLSFAFPSAQEAFAALKSLALDETES